MGYDVHITRKADWIDDEPKIPLGEWLAVARSDHEMGQDGLIVTNPAEADDTKDEGAFVWIAYSRHDPDLGMAVFDYQNGDIHVKSPDREILRKMWSLAQALTAAVQGDEGELYDAEGHSEGIPGRG